MSVFVTKTIERLKEIEYKKEAIKREIADLSKNLQSANDLLTELEQEFEQTQDALWLYCESKNIPIPAIKIETEQQPE